MAEIKKQSNQELEQVVGGVSYDGWAVVSGLESGYLALRDRPGYDYDNEIQSQFRR